ncbi:MAG: hypothetical protein AB7Q37_01555 [Pyrinomonadaceae bacterium]
MAEARNYIDAVFALSLPMQQSQLSQQSLPSSDAETAIVVALPSFFLIGHESPQHSWASPFAWSLPCSAPLFFIGQLSLQQDADAVVLNVVWVYAYAAIARPKTATIAKTATNFFFIVFLQILKTNAGCDGRAGTGPAGIEAKIALMLVDGF